MTLQTTPHSDSWLNSSWQRSRHAGLKESETPEHIRLNRVDLQQKKDESALLINVIEKHAFPLFKQALAHTQSRLIIADNNGVILTSWGQEKFANRLTDVALEAGVCWQEKHKGTNAIGTALTEKNLTCVRGQQHFISNHRFLSCTASPIFSPDGKLIGILDITSEQQIHNIQVNLLVQTMVQQVESALMNHVPQGSYRFDIALSDSLLHTGWQGIIVTNESGKVLAYNSIASLLLEKPILIGETLDAFWQQSWPPQNAAPRSIKTSNNNVSIACQALAPKNRTFTASNSLHYGDSAVEKIWQQACKVINKDIPLLILGETGVGKEQFVKQLHQVSQRKKAPLVAVNCGSLPSELLESELFGYVGGAFTGANRQGYLGKIRQANKGILFLDEIGEMPLSAQSRLLRVLQEREVVPIGSNSIEHVDIQIIAATHNNLLESVEKGTFRQDLFYRLNGLTLNIPALRDRDDLKALIHQIHGKYSEQKQHISPTLTKLLQTYAWPGNLRELDSMMKVACLLSEGKKTLELSDIPANIQQQLFSEPVKAEEPIAQPSLKQSIHSRLLETYKSNSGNISKTARQLGISRNTLYRKLKEIGCK